MATHRALVCGKSSFGLTGTSLHRLGTTPIFIEVQNRNAPDVYPGPARYRKLLAKTPEERRAGVRDWRIRQHKRLCGHLKPYEFETLHFNGDPIGARVTLPAREIRSIASLPCVDNIHILRIQGRRPKRSPKNAKPYWFSVKARFAIQFEDEDEGMQDYEDRILLVKAGSFKDAERKALREFRQYEIVSLTTTGHFYRWAFETILDIYQTYIDKIDPSGMEVYSEMKKRRMKPQYEWHPTEDDA